MLGREARLGHAAILRGYAMRLLVLLLLRLLLRRHALRGWAPGLGLGRIQRGSPRAERAQCRLCGLAALARGLPRCGLVLLRALHGNQHKHQQMYRTRIYPTLRTAGIHPTREE